MCPFLPRGTHTHTRLGELGSSWGRPRVVPRAVQGVPWERLFGPAYRQIWRIHGVQKLVQKACLPTFVFQVVS